MRQASNILMATLIVSALFYGNCLSCPQVLLARATHQPGHGCCHRPAPKAVCQTQVLNHFVKAQGGSTAPTLAVSGVVTALPAVMVPARPAIAPGPAADGPPPGTLALQSPIRV